MKLFLATLMVATLSACAMTPEQSGYLMEQIDQANANQPKRTYCTKVDDQLLCETR